MAETEITGGTSGVLMLRERFMGAAGGEAALRADVERFLERGQQAPVAVTGPAEPPPGSPIGGRGQLAGCGFGGGGG